MCVWYVYVDMCVYVRVCVKLHAPMSASVSLVVSVYLFGQMGRFRVEDMCAYARLPMV